MPFPYTCLICDKKLRKVELIDKFKKGYSTKTSNSYTTDMIGFLFGEKVRPHVIHAVIVIFLEYFAWGLLSVPAIEVLNETFPSHTFLMNGIVQGIKGFLSFLCAPLLGSLSDAYGRKTFLMVTVCFTCLPIPFMRIAPLWYFALLTVSGTCAVTFTIVFAYVSDITNEEERTRAYGLVSATFAASLIISPAIGASLAQTFSTNFVVLIATAVALLDLLFISIIPESLPPHPTPAAASSARLCESDDTSLPIDSSQQPLVQLDAPPAPALTRPQRIRRPINWNRADPFTGLRQIGQDQLILMLCITIFLSYLPEAGEYSSFIVYLRLVVGFSDQSVAMYIAYLGFFSVIAQTIIMSKLMTVFGPKKTIVFGLWAEFIQLSIFGFFASTPVMWIAGLIAALGTISYPSISAFVSNHASPEQQGVAQGIVTGIRGLCMGLGPLLFGFIFSLFRIDPMSLDAPAIVSSVIRTDTTSEPSHMPPSPLVGHITVSPTVRAVPQPLTVKEYSFQEAMLPGPPFAFGAALVFLALIVSVLIPDSPHQSISLSPTPTSSTTGSNGMNGSSGGSAPERLAYGILRSVCRVINSVTAPTPSHRRTRSNEFSSAHPADVRRATPGHFTRLPVARSPPRLSSQSSNSGQCGPASEASTHQHQHEHQHEHEHHHHHHQHQQRAMVLSSAAQLQALSSHSHEDSIAPLGAAPNTWSNALAENRAPKSPTPRDGSEWLSASSGPVASSSGATGWAAMSSTNFASLSPLEPLSDSESTGGTAAPTVLTPLRVPSQPFSQWNQHMPPTPASLHDSLGRGFAGQYQVKHL